MKSVLTLLVILGFTCAQADELSVKILNQIHKKTSAVSMPLKSWPQNFGGESEKLYLNNSDKLKKKAYEIALSDEAVFQIVMKDVFLPLQTMIEQQKVILPAVEKKGSQYFFNNTEFLKTLEFDGITQSQWKASKENVNLKSFEEKFSGYVKEYSKIEYVSVSPFSMSVPLSERNQKTSQPNLFKTEVRFDIRGLDKNQFKRNDRFTANISVALKSAEPLVVSKWQITDFTVQSGETLTAAQSFFEEKNLFGSAQPANYLRREAIRRGGYALSVSDWNNDGTADLVIGHMGKIEFYSGQKDRTFLKIENQKLGIEDETLVKSVVVNDFDNDGLKDLLIVRFAPSEQMGKDIITYQGVDLKNGIGFKKLTSIKNRYPAYYAMPSAVADYNNDGKLDFYVGFPGAKDFTVLNKKAHGFAGIKEPHPQGLFYNTGNFAFEEVTREKMPYSKRHNAYTDGYPDSAAVFPHTSAGLDYDLDGNMDIVVVDDKANLSPLYKNTGNGEFTQTANKIGVVNSDFGMGFTAADLDNDGKLEFIYTNVNFLPAERLTNSLSQNFSEYITKIPGTISVKIFKTLDGKNYSDVTALTGISDAGEGVGGVEVVDYNNDGFMDIYVTNGLWSGNTRDQDLSSQFVRAYSKFDYDFQEIMGAAQGTEEANTSFMKILTGFEGLVETGKVKKGMHPSMAGFQRNRLFRNNGNGTFTEVGYLAGVDSIADGYIVATADLNRDGKMDLILRNGDPGTDSNRFPSVQVYQNKYQNNKSVILSFVGGTSNRDAIGVIAEAQVGDKKLTRHLTANNGSVQSEQILHFGLGNAKKIDLLTVRWPSGITENLKNIAPGYHQLKEPLPAVKAAGL